MTIVDLTYLIKTLDKKHLMGTLRHWRKQSTSKEEVDIINELLQLIEEGEFDG